MSNPVDMQTRTRFSLALPLWKHRGSDTNRKALFLYVPLRSACPTQSQFKTALAPPLLLPRAAPSVFTLAFPQSLYHFQLRVTHPPSKINKSADAEVMDSVWEHLQKKKKKSMRQARVCFHETRKRHSCKGLGGGQQKHDGWRDMYSLAVYLSYAWQSALLLEWLKKRQVYWEARQVILEKVHSFCGLPFFTMYE